MHFVADLHIHSRYARATSRDLNPENLYKWAALKGINVVGTGDFTHPLWYAELQEKLEPTGAGLYRLKAPWRQAVEQTLPPSCRHEVQFLLSVEISSIYKKNGRTRKVHNLVMLPDLASVETFNQRLGALGNLQSRWPAHSGSGQPCSPGFVPASVSGSAVHSSPYLDTALCGAGLGVRV